MSADDYIERILKARVYDVAIGVAARPHAAAVCRALDCEVLLKREDLQPVFSFKLRGAYNKIANLSETVARRGVICASAGNHAQGVALAAQASRHRRRDRDAGDDAADQGAAPSPHWAARWCCTATCSIRRTSMRSSSRASATSPSCIRSTIPTSSRARARSAWRSCGSRPAISMPSSCRWAVADSSPASPGYVKYLSPRTRIVGVEPEDAAAMYESLRAGTRVTLDHVGHVRRWRRGEARGRGNVQRSRSKYVDEIVLVTTDEICAAIQDTFEDTRTIPEPSGALRSGRPEAFRRARAIRRANGSSRSTAAPT